MNTLKLVRNLPQYREVNSLYILPHPEMFKQIREVFDDGEIMEIHCEGFLSVFDVKSITALLPELVKLLAIGGRIFIEDYDFGLIANAMAFGRLSIEGINEMFVSTRGFLTMDLVKNWFKQMNLNKETAYYIYDKNLFYISGVFNG